jgi:hypothetical protein
MSQQFRFRHAMACGLVLGTLGLVPQVHAASAWDGMAPPRVWGNFQYGLEMLQSRGDAMYDIDKSSVYWKIEAGMRVNRDWLVGVGVNGIPLDSANKMTQLYGTAIFNPGRGPWLYQVALGQATYQVNVGGKTFDEKYSGLGAQLGVGRDWTPASIDDVHLGVRLTFEYSWLGARDEGFGVGGSLNHSRVSLGFSMSFY